MNDDNGDYEWKPPTEAEMKVIRARRERDDQISKRMGDYLLKGYKMLGSTCHCGTILLQDKRGVNYCIACSELDSDVDKDNPVMNQEAALATQREHQASSSSTASSQISSGHGSHTLAFSANQASQTPSSSANQRQAFSANHIPPEVCVRTDRDPNLPPRTVNVVDILKEKMCWACNELQRTSSVEYSSQLCQLVKHCAEAVHSVQTNLTN